MFDLGCLTLLVVIMAQSCYDPQEAVRMYVKTQSRNETR